MYLGMGERFLKNLVLLHLESLNLINYRSNPELFPNLREMENRSKVYDRYFSTATSTFMVMTDLLYGNMEQHECCRSIDYIPDQYRSNHSMLDDLKNEGYQTRCLYYPWIPDVNSAEEKHTAGFDNHIELVDSRDECLKKLKEGLKSKRFAYMICNCTSNLSLNRELDITEQTWNTDYWGNAYRAMDRFCGAVIDLLEEKDLLGNTIVVMYGDHGDDYWGHGMHAGLAHAIEPNNLLIRTPLIVWDGKQRSQAEHNMDLIQTTDIPNLINRLLQEKSTEDLPKRKYTISRNAYAAQPVRADSFNKAYSVSDGRYLLMVTSHGLEMYDTYMDMACINNLLQYFDYDKEIIRAKYMKEIFHFPVWWNSREQRIVRNKFYELKTVLFQKMLHLYEAADLTQDHMLKEMQMNMVGIED